MMKYIVYFYAVLLLVLANVTNLKAQHDSALYYSYLDTNKSIFYIQQIEAEGSEINKMLHKLSTANYCLNNNKPLQTIEILENNYELLSNKRWFRLRLYNLLSKAYLLIGQNEKTIYYCTKVVTEESPEIDARVFALNTIAEMWIRQGNTTEALKFLKAASLLGAKNDSPEMSVTYLLNSFIFINEGVESTTIEYLRLAINYSRKQLNPIVEMKALNNVGVYWYDRENYDSSYFYMEKIKIFSKPYNLMNLYAGAQVNIANILMIRDSIQKAKEILHEIFSIKEDLNYRLNSRSYYTYAQIMIKENDFPLAHKYCNMFLSHADSANDFSAFLLGYSLLAEIYNSSNYPKEAYLEQLKYSQLSDSLNDAERVLLFELYETEVNKLEQNNKIITQKLRLNTLEDAYKKTKQSYFWFQIISIISLIIIFNISFIIIIRRRLKLKRKFTSEFIKESEEFRLKIASDLHDNIGQKLSLLIHSDRSQMTDDIRQEVNTISELIRNISKILYPPTLNFLGLTSMLRKLFREIESKTQIKTLLNSDPLIEDLLSLDQKLNIYRIIQECINNSLKHAKASSINISICIKQQYIELLYHDINNVRTSDKLTPGFGLTSIKTRAEIIGAKTWYSLQKSGFNLRMKVPILQKENKKE